MPPRLYLPCYFSYVRILCIYIYARSHQLTLLPVPTHMYSNPDFAHKQGPQTVELVWICRNPGTVVLPLNRASSQKHTHSCSHPTWMECLPRSSQDTGMSVDEVDEGLAWPRVWPIATHLGNQIFHHSTQGTRLYFLYPPLHHRLCKRHRSDLFSLSLNILNLEHLQAHYR